MFNFDPSSMFDPDKLQEESIPSYDEWLLRSAKVLEAHPALNLIRGVFKGIRYLKAREEAFISVLESRGLWGSGDTELLNAMTEQHSQSYNKELIKMIVRQVSSGDLTLTGIGGGNVSLTPDAALAALNEFVLSDNQLTGRSVEILANLLGEGEETLKKRYDADVERIEALNKARSTVRDAISAGGDLFGEGGILSGLGGSFFNQSDDNAPDEEQGQDQE